MAPITRRSLLAGAAGLGALAAAGGLSGCGSRTAISSDPRELVLWYWNRSADPKLLAQMAKGIPGAEDYTLRADVLGGTWDTKLRTSLAGNAYIPDVTFINSNVSLYFPNESMFLDLNELGAETFKDQYFDWKWELGVTPTNRFCFFPLDTGPTGMYYRTDVLQKAGIDPDPDAVSEQIKTWDAYIELGSKLKKNAGAFIQSSASTLFAQYINASAERYFDKAGKPLYLDDSNTIRDAWDTAVKAIKAGVTGNQQNDTDKNAAWTSGKTAANIEAVWWAQILADTAPDTKGKWRLASQPVRPGNSGGSFVCLPHTCKNPEAGFKFMTWLNSAKNQATSFNTMQLFPSAIESFELGTMKSNTGFFGDQDPLDFFLEAAKAVPTAFISTFETQAAYFGTEITNVESGKDADQAWDDAVAQTNKTLRKRGIEV
ncbi:ABC transporter substrate-binding protein [Microlunatus soli]|uniref:Cellobiose transport system substrate-binding protein n=1 Tax=Microlunatus soli TaxID=630515 RepID=A0A1H1S5H7_9ACTN|nr:extracellular solute-binding protein [Microlunatus soli]SDS43257.1 cellobiose transport system substrate-binding protein [Microlunatus soli]